MDANNNGVTPADAPAHPPADLMADHRSTTDHLLDHIDRLDHVRQVEKTTAERSQNARIADINQEIGHSLKLAHIYAVRDLADAVRMAGGRVTNVVNMPTPHPLDEAAFTVTETGSYT